MCVFKYKTYMSALSISNHLIMRMLQRQNTKRVIAKRMVSGEANNAKEEIETQNTDNFPSIVVEGGVTSTENKNTNINTEDVVVREATQIEENSQVA